MGNLARKTCGLGSTISDDADITFFILWKFATTEQNANVMEIVRYEQVLCYAVSVCLILDYLHKN